MESQTLFIVLLSLYCFFNPVSAEAFQAQIDEKTFQQYLHEDRAGLAQVNAPVWYFGQAHDDPPCIPTWAYNGSETTPDIYDAAHRTPGIQRCPYNKGYLGPIGVGCLCRNPGIGIGNPAPPFPVYFTINQCSATEVRVSYNLFYQKDGFLMGIPPTKGLVVDTGHDWDWERVVVVFSRIGTNPGLYPPYWQATNLLLSAHASYDNIPWGQIQNTLSTDQLTGTNLRLPQGQQGYDHPKVYAAWAKHANFHTKNTAWNDPLYQLKSWAFRSDDWWGVVDKKNYIEADESTPVGKVMLSQEWGEADSTPPRVQGMMCGISLGDVNSPETDPDIVDTSPDVASLAGAKGTDIPGRRRRR